MKIFYLFEKKISKSLKIMTWIQILFTSWRIQHQYEIYPKY